MELTRQENYYYGKYETFEIPDKTFLKFYNLSENLAICEVTVLFKGTWVSGYISFWYQTTEFM
jgi:hypothetical protein